MMPQNMGGKETSVEWKCMRTLLSHVESADRADSLADPTATSSNEAPLAHSMIGNY